MSDVELLDVTDSETTCALCYAEFLDPDDLSVHITQVHGEQTLPTLIHCHFCASQLSDLLNYALHLRDAHLASLSCCKYCNRVFQDHDQFRKHESRHYTYVPKSQFSCSQCKKLFSNVFELELHERREHPNATEGVLLDECLPLLSTLLNIKALKFLHSLNEDINTYTCVRCELTTSNAQEYIEHLKTNNCHSLACDSCSSVYTTRKNLIKHYQSHKECFHNSLPKYKQCMECCKMFESKLWSHHTKKCRPIKCRTCNIIYSTMTDLVKHQSEVHPLTVVLETCKYCHKEFAGKISLLKHMERSHSDMHLYKYKCIDCDAVFKHPKKLFGHFSSTHKDLEPYTCKICDKKFKFRKKFTIHIKLDHKSIGYIDFDENFHVFFTDKKTTKRMQTEEPKKSLKSKEENVNEVENNDDQVSLETVNKIQTESNAVQIDDKNWANQNTMEKQVRFHLEKEAGEKEKNDEVNINSDFMSATETEGNQTEAESETTKTKKKTRKRNRAKRDDDFVVLDSSDDEPLLELQKRVKMRRAKLHHATWNRKKEHHDLKNNKKRFICNICKKYCYTFQNYHNHYSSHYTNATLKCVKCLKTFNSKDELNKHCSEEHLTSQLTQTLKNLLEKRKKGENTEMSTAERFQQTIKSVVPSTDKVKVTVKVVNKNQSVKNFIESFTPEDAPKAEIPVEINNIVTIKHFKGPRKEPLIKMTKCDLTPVNFSATNLSMPVPFREKVSERHKVTIKQVFTESSTEFQDVNNDDQSDYDKSEPIPEVAEEVMLEETQEPSPKTLYVPHKIVLPTLPAEINKVRIALLQAEAPFYKIVKVADVLNLQDPKAKNQVDISQKDILLQDDTPVEKIHLQEPNTKKQVDVPKKDIQLPDGTKLVTVNPLAHLLGDTPVEKILANTKSKYYQPKPKDFEMAIAKAMLRLENPDAFPKKKRKKNDMAKFK